MGKVIDKVAKMTAHEFTVEAELEPRDSLAIQAECEVVDVTDKPVGEEDEIKRIYRLRIKMAEIRLLENGVYSEPELTQTGRKSKSKSLRDTLFLYWSQQLSAKMTFEAFYDLWMDKKIAEIKETLV